MADEPDTGDDGSHRLSGDDHESGPEETAGTPPRSSLAPPGSSPPPPPPPGAPLGEPATGHRDPNGGAQSGHRDPNGGAGATPVFATSAPADPGGLPGHIVPLRPLTVGDTLDGIFQSLRASFGRLVAIVLLVVAPYQLLNGALVNRAVPSLDDMTDPAALEGLMDEFVGALGWFAALLLVGLLIGVFVAGALTAVASAADRGETITVGEAMRRSFEHSGATVGSTVLVLLAVMVVMVALVIPFALIAMLNEIVAFVLALPVFLVLVLGGLVLSYLVIPIAMEEEQGAWTTFRRAVSLFRRRFGYIAGLTALVMLLLIAVTLGLGFGFIILSLLLGGVGWVAESIQAILYSVISSPVTALAAWVIHRDARVRLEAYDVVVRNEALGHGPVT